jgi:hypothetical protein
MNPAGEIMPTSMLPYESREARAIEINIEPSSYTAPPVPICSSRHAQR